VEEHPHLLLFYAQSVPEAMGKYYYGRWWKLRGQAAELPPSELQSYYALTLRWGNREDFEEWAQHHAALGVRDYQQWAALWHAWGEDQRAWQLLALKVPEPAFPNIPPSVPREVLETTWRTKPENLVNAQQLAFARKQAGDQEGSDEIIVTVANEQNAPPWFVQKAAWILGNSGHADEAVELLLRAR